MRKRMFLNLIPLSCLLALLCHERIKNDKLHKDTNLVYNDMSLLTNDLFNRVREFDDVVFDVGSYNCVKTNFESDKLEYCSNNNVGIGIIIRLDNLSVRDVYMNIEYIKTLVNDYKITLPIYFDVDNIFEEKTLSKSDKFNLIDEFIRGCQSNNIYYNLLVSYPNMSDEMYGYKFIFKDHFKKDSNTYNVSKYDTDKIRLEDYNNKAFFKNNVREFGSISDVSWKNDIDLDCMSVFNSYGISDDMKSVMIPGEYVDVNEVDSEYKVGIDVSRWQGDIAWEDVDVNFAIIAVKDFSSKEDDIEFVNNVEGCIQNDIPYGFYVYSRAMDLSSFQNEVRYFFDKVSPYDVKYPLYIDLETDEWFNLEANDKFDVMSHDESYDYVRRMFMYWHNEALKNGYIPGIYSSPLIYNKLKEILGDYIDNFSIWITDAKYYDKDISEDNLPDISNDNGVNMIQFTENGSIDGISNKVDLDYCYTDYSKEYVNNPEREFNKFKLTPITAAEIIVGSPLLLSGGIALMINKKKKKNKVKRRKK